MKNRERLEACYHEASHAVVADALGYPLDTVCVGDSAGSGSVGVTVFPVKRRPGLRDKMQEIIVDFAGLIGAHKAGLYEPGCESADMADVCSLLESSPALEFLAEHILSVSREKAQKIVNARWPKIQKLAGVLYWRGQIEGKRLKSFLKPAKKRYFLIA